MWATTMVELNSQLKTFIEIRLTRQSGLGLALLKDIKIHLQLYYENNQNKYKGLLLSMKNLAEPPHTAINHKIQQRNLPIQV